MEKTSRRGGGRSCAYLSRIPPRRHLVDGNHSFASIGTSGQPPVALRHAPRAQRGRRMRDASLLHEKCAENVW